MIQMRWQKKDISWFNKVGDSMRNHLLRLKGALSSSAVLLELTTPYDGHFFTARPYMEVHDICVGVVNMDTKKCISVVPYK